MKVDINTLSGKTITMEVDDAPTELEQVKEEILSGKQSFSIRSYSPDFASTQEIQEQVKQIVAQRLKRDIDNASNNLLEKGFKLLTMDWMTATPIDPSFFIDLKAVTAPILRLLKDNPKVLEALVKLPEELRLPILNQQLIAYSYEYGNLKERLTHFVKSYDKNSTTRKVFLFLQVVLSWLVIDDLGEKGKIQTNGVGNAAISAKTRNGLMHGQQAYAPDELGDPHTALHLPHIKLDGHDIAIWNKPENILPDFVLITTYSHLLNFLVNTISLFGLLAAAQDCFGVSNWYAFVDFMTLCIKDLFGISYRPAPANNNNSCNTPSTTSPPPASIPKEIPAYVDKSTGNITPIENVQTIHEMLNIPLPTAVAPNPDL